MKYKVGNRVKVKNLDWYNKNRDEFDEVPCKGYTFVKSMVKYCDMVLTIKRQTEYGYYVKENSFNWTDEMFEGLVEEEVGLVDNLSSRWVNEFNLPQGYQFVDENGNVINATKIILEKKKKEYPKTYEKCCKILDITPIRRIGDIGYKRTLLNVFEKLLVCRDAYWKIAGEEMCLDKPWEPDWTNQESPKYCIAYVESQIKTAERNIINTILSFPTAEMRDAFYENFKELIESCKELL